MVSKGAVPKGRTAGRGSTNANFPVRKSVMPAGVAPANNHLQYTPRTGSPVPRGPRPANPLKRQRTLNLIVAGAVLLFGGRLVQLQVLSPGLAKEALSARMSKPRTLSAARGRILDRNAVVLATTVDRYQLIANPLAILGFRSSSLPEDMRLEWLRNHPEVTELENGALGVAQLVAPILGQDTMELAAKFNAVYRVTKDEAGNDILDDDGNPVTRLNQYTILNEDLDFELWRQINEIGLPADYLYTEVFPKRVYPLDSVAGALIGFVNFDKETKTTTAQAGIERRYEEILAGKDGIRSYEHGANGLPIPGGVYNETPAVNGGDVILTIDSNIQREAQRVIDETVTKYAAEYGMIIVQNVKTGELWAIADSGGVNPNVRSDPAAAEALARGSRAVQDIFEPGSTGKIITMAAGLETGAVTPLTRFTVPYLFEAPNTQTCRGQRWCTFHDSKDHPVQYLTATGILAKSSNTGMVQIAENIPPETQMEYLNKFHLGEFTGLDMPGESRGIVQPLPWDGRTRYTVAFGQGGMSVNAIQATGVYSTVANGGLYTAPSLVRGVREAESDKVYPEASPTVSRSIESETANTLMNMLEQATADEGTAKLAQIPGYRIAGKTGTAEIILQGRHTIMSSFIGVAPADNPEFVVSVFVNAPQNAIYGGTVAAPAFREVMGYLLQQQSIPPSSLQQNPLPITWN